MDAGYPPSTVPREINWRVMTCDDDEYCLTNEQIIEAAKDAEKRHDTSDLVALITILHNRGMKFAEINKALKDKE